MAPTQSSPIFHSEGLKNNFTVDAKVDTNNGKVEPFSILGNKIIVVQRQEHLVIIDILAMRKYLLLQQLKQVQGSIALDTPQSVTISPGINFNEDFAVWCQDLGFSFELIGAQKLLLRAVPLKLQMLPLKLDLLLQKLHELFHKKASVFEVYQTVLECLDFSAQLPHALAQELVAQFENVPSKGVWRIFNIFQLQELC